MELRELLENHGMTLQESQLAQLELYADLLIRWNDRFNLTAITDRQDIYLKHFADCLLLTGYPLGESLADVGTGAGFPAIVLKIARPQLRITMLEPNHKKISFLSEVIDRLNLENIEAVAQRSEDYAREHYEQFDTVTSRAVAPLNILSELCLPLVRTGGHFLAMKGPRGIEELQESASALRKLSAEHLATGSYDLDGQQRLIIDIVKTAPTNRRYPRNYSQIKKKPL
ncbi:MAG: 16S rRNA (guanine(527)-N(7))-methyltransferase RsmG [Erysipelotrichaceae bacterium]|nr:16S rRNA (guanine(527)-N(7))-methyltransferase RsmG [Erysipelotrichaceae bacterium]MBR5049584.1 16S rRNA (guanine(527)-N(7))-methyltransferase RsmG [Erysipelotrichaceae bacterium]